VPSSVAAAPPPPRERQQWLDVARGVAVLLVVAAHVVDFVSMRGERAALLEPPLQVVQAFRVPALFFVAGLLLAGYRDRPWRRVVRDRVLLFAWLLVVWLVVERLVDVALGRDPWQSPLELLGYVARWFAFPDHNLWFLAGVLWMTLVVRLLARRLWLLLLVAGVMLSGLLPALPLGPLERFYVVQAPYVLLGVVLAPLVLHVGARASLRACWGAVALFVPLGVLRWYGVLDPLPGALVRVTVALTGIAALLAVGRLLAEVRGAAVWAHVGRNTLAVYLVHYPLSLLVFRRLDVVAPELVPDNPYVAAVVVVALGVGAGLGLAALVRVTRLGGVLTAPRWLLRLFDRHWPEGGRPGGRTTRRRPTRRPAPRPVPGPGPARLTLATDAPGRVAAAPSTSLRPDPAPPSVGLCGEECVSAVCSGERRDAAR